MTLPDTLYRADLLWSRNLGELQHVPDGGLLVDAAGLIRASGPHAELAAAFPEAAGLDLRGCWILPGLIDLHCHLPQHESVAVDGLELLPWLETVIFPAEARFGDPAVARDIAGRFFREQLAWGTTTCVGYATVHAGAADAAFQEAERLGIRALLGKAMMDRNAPEALLEDTARSLAESEALCQAWHGRDGGRIGYVFTPRFAPACSRELMSGVGRLAERHGAWIQTHLSENLDELAWVADLFPEARDYVDVYARAGMLGPRTLLGHGIHLSPRERQALREAGARLVHCPSSNTFLRSGIMPVRRWLQEGISLGLGTDVGAGPSLSLWSEMAAACGASKQRWAERRVLARRLEDLEDLEPAARDRISEALDLTPSVPLAPAEAFHLATAGAAACLGLEGRIGKLEPGMDADFLVVDPRVTDPAKDRPADAPERLLSRLVYRAQPGLVRAAHVRGRRCHPAEP